MGEHSHWGPRTTEHKEQLLAAVGACGGQRKGLQGVLTSQGQAQALGQGCKLGNWFSITEYPRLSALTTGIYFHIVLEARNPRSSYWRELVSPEASLLGL